MALPKSNVLRHTLLIRRSFKPTSSISTLHKRQQPPTQAFQRRKAATKYFKIEGATSTGSRNVVHTRPRWSFQTFYSNLLSQSLYIVQNTINSQIITICTNRTKLSSIPYLTIHNGPTHPQLRDHLQHHTEGEPAHWPVRTCQGWPYSPGPEARQREPQQQPKGCL